MASILDKCAGAPRKNFGPGTVLLSEGETSGRLYILAEGSVEVLRGDTQVAVIGHAGAVVGGAGGRAARGVRESGGAAQPAAYGNRQGQVSGRRVGVRRCRKLPQIESR